MALGDKSVRFDIEGRNKTTKAFKQVNSSMSKLTGVAGKLAGALAGAFAIGKIGAFGKETLAAADAIGKFADRQAFLQMNYRRCVMRSIWQVLV